MNLFSSFQLGHFQLPNRIVMAPMTRSRAHGGQPNDLMREYYTQRASAGLIISEGIAPSPNALGYARIPGLFAVEQVEGFRAITGSVHAAGGRIVAQLMHVGRIAHPLNQPPAARIVAPSAVQAGGQMYTDQQGPQPFPIPEALSLAELSSTRDEIVQAARNAMAAGFDAVELHGANGYLLEQFLHPHTNRRDDAYGGSIENRNRFVSEVVRASADAIGPERLGLRLSPYGTFNDLPAHGEVQAAYASLASTVRGILYLHLIRAPHPEFAETANRVQRAFEGPIILNGGFDRLSAEEALAQGQADLISFGRPFIANPDFVQRLKNNASLAAPQYETFYTPGSPGYIDYPTL